MRRESTTAGSITYDLSRKRRYATTTFLIGLFVGGSVGLAGGGPLVQQLVVAALLTAIVSGGSYWVLCRLAAAVTGGTGYYRAAYPTLETETTAGSDRGVAGPGASDGSSPVNRR